MKIRYILILLSLIVYSCTNTVEGGGKYGATHNIHLVCVQGLEYVIDRQYGGIAAVINRNGVGKLCTGDSQ